MAKSKSQQNPHVKKKAAKKPAAQVKERGKAKQPVQKGKHPGGRPTDFKPEYVEQVEKLCKLGATDRQIADFFGVQESTINNWKKGQPQFLESMRAGKDIADMAVAQKLFERAIGSTVNEQVAIKVKDVKYEKGKKVSETERVEVVDVLKENPPDTVAAKFWLNNRKSDSWKEKVDHKVEMSGEIEVEII